MNVTIFRAAWFVLVLLYLLVWARTLVRITKTPDEAFRRGSAVSWASIVVFVPVLGLVAYYVAGRPRAAR